MTSPWHLNGHLNEHLKVGRLKVSWLKVRPWRYLHHMLGFIVLMLFLWRLANMLSPSQTAPDWSNVPLSADGQQNQGYSYGIYYKGHKIGFAEQQRLALDDGTSLFRDRAFWHFVTQGRQQDLAMDSETRVDAKWQVTSMSARIDAGLAKISAKVQVKKDALLIEIINGGQVHKQRITIHEPILAPGLLRAYVASKHPETGAHFSLKTFNPMLRSIDTLGILVDAKTQRGWRITEISQGSIKTHAEIDSQGFTISETSPLGFQMKREPREQALRFDKNILPPDLILASAVSANGIIPSDIRQLSKLVLRISGFDAKLYPALFTAGQNLDDGILTVQVAPWPRPDSTANFADRDKVSASLPAESLLQIKQALKPTPLVQSNDPQIIAKAQEIVAGEQDPAQMALKLTRWVHSNVQKISNIGVPSAIEVLQTRQGDCNEHTVLLTALARAAGLPARMAAGLVLADLQGQGPAFYYHAWVEFWLGTSWHAVDPTFGQVPADASHLRFVIGSLQEQVALLGLMGQLHLQILSSEAKLQPIFAAPKKAHANDHADKEKP